MMDYEDYTPDFTKDRQAAAEWARRVLADPQVCILDTETTGLGSDAEIIQLAVLAPDGTVVFESLFRPAGPIPPAATNVHGITDAAVAGAPTFAAQHAALCAALAGKLIIVWNAEYDSRLLDQTCRRYNLPLPACAGWDCAMLKQAQYAGDWSSYFGSYRWQKLEWACEGTGVMPDHTAAGDCRATLAVIRAMAAS